MAQRCMALNEHGRQCRRNAVGNYTYHGQSELYSWDGPYPTWVIAAFCQAHHRKDDETFEQYRKNRK